jgi:hypothetical protein
MAESAKRVRQIIVVGAAVLIIVAVTDVLDGAYVDGLRTTAIAGLFGLLASGSSAKSAALRWLAYVLAFAAIVLTLLG